jgi:hypothetical protein
MGRKKTRIPEYDRDMPLSKMIEEMRKSARETLQHADMLEKLLGYALGTEKESRDGTDTGA